MCVCRGGGGRGCYITLRKLLSRTLCCALERTLSEINKIKVENLEVDVQFGPVKAAKTRRVVKPWQ